MKKRLLALMGKKNELKQKAISITDAAIAENRAMTAEEQAEFTARENEIIVASYESASTDDNGGHLRFYQTTSPGVDLTLKPGWEYSGFAKIVDAVYKEVRR